MKTPSAPHLSRLDREVEREREQRHKNDDAKARLSSDDDLRTKDARDSEHSSNLHRTRT